MNLFFFGGGGFFFFFFFPPLFFFVVGFFFLEIKPIVPEKNWYSWRVKEIGNMTLISRYAAPNATLLFLGDKINLLVKSFDKPNTLEIYVDGNFFEKYELVPENYTNISIKLESLKESKTFHMLLFYPYKECEIPSEVASPICFEIITNF